MSKPNRIGNNPLSWIQDSRTLPENRAPSEPKIEIQPKVLEKQTAESLQCNQSLQCKHSDISDSKSEEMENIEKKAPQGLPKGWTRATFIIQEDYLELIKDCAYWERKSIKDLINQILQEFIDKQNVQPRPKKKRLNPEA
jgi:hypothetical protein